MKKLKRAIPIIIPNQNFYNNDWRFGMNDQTKQESEKQKNRKNQKLLSQRENRRPHY